MPQFYCWDGDWYLEDGWSLGYTTGPDKDLVCIKSKIEDPVLAEYALSPICSSRLLATIAFCLKRILLRIDYNTQRR